MANSQNKRKEIKDADFIWELIRLARPVHWVKNISLFAALIFTGTLLTPFYYITAIKAFIVFCLATSSTYIFNDVIDVESDRAHPIKKNRPVAKGTIPASIALMESFFLGVFSLFLAGKLNQLFFLSVFVYLILQILYSLYLKNISIIDILIIASGFIIRIYAGAFVIDAHLSVWFLLCAISTSLFLASGKRRAELNIEGDGSSNTRKSLSKYKRELLNSYVTMFGNASWISWALFTFFESPKASPNLWLVLAEISKAITINKLLMITIPVVIFGIMQYESLIFEEKSEAPEKVLLSDSSLIASIIIWGVLVVWILYVGAPAL